MLESKEIHVIFVDDGSTDSTHIRLASEFKDFDNFEILRLNQNVGKSNALRVGMLRALEIDFPYIGTFDADGAISPTDLLTALSICKLNPDSHLVSGARILLAGSDVSRNNFRRWTGRIIATIIATILRIQIYDPQSPCKVYRASVLENNLGDEFRTRWFVDTEIILRSKRSNSESCKVVEFPVVTWRDVEGSHLSILQALRVANEIRKLYLLQWQAYPGREK